MIGRMGDVESRASEPQGAGRAPHHGRRVAFRSLATLSLTLLVYYSVPLDWDREPTDLLVPTILFVAGLAGLIVLIITQARRQVQAGDDPGVRVQSLLMLIYPVILFFSLTYLVLEQVSPGEMSGLETRTDSLYFTVVTLGTVGFGDVHPVGQVARAVATVQVAFDLLFVGMLVSIATQRVQALGRRYRREHGEGD